MLVHGSLPSKASSSKYNIICNSSDKNMKWQHGVFLSISWSRAVWCIDTNFTSLFPSLEGIK